MEKSIDYSLLGKRVSEQYPWIAEKLMTQPDLDDLEELPETFRLFTEEYPIELLTVTKKELYMFRIVFIAVAVKLFDPEMLVGDKSKMKDRLRKSISEVLEMHNTQISDNLKIVTSYLKCNREFSMKVTYFYELVKKKIIKKTGATM